MGVPNTDTFTLQDVVDEVNPTTDELVDCFSDAIASKFDSTYSGDKNELLNFRNYGAIVNLRYFVINNTGQTRFFSYTNPSGNVAFTSLPGFGGGFVCAQEDTVILPSGMSKSTDGSTCV